MVSSSVLLAAGLVASVSAAPAPPLSVPGHRKGGFTVPQVRAQGYVQHGPSAMARALLKFGKEPSAELKASIKSWKVGRRDMLKRANGSAPAIPEQSDIEYLTPVDIGTPAQTLNLDFDSGSSDLWVFSSKTPRSSVNGQAIYTPEKSSTAKQLGNATWSISYGDGSSSSGIVFTDTVNVGGLTVASQAVEAAQKVSASFTEDENNDGLLGLAFSKLNTVRPAAQKTWFDNVKADLDESLWTADLKAGAPGTYNFGWIDESLYTGDIAYTKVDSSRGFWMFTADSYSVGSGSNSSTASTSPSPSASASAPPFPTSASSGSRGSGHGHHNKGNSETIASFFGLARRSPSPSTKKHQSASTTGAGTGTGTSSAAAASFSGIADTGTTLSLFPDTVCEDYYAQVSGATLSPSIGGYVFACDAALPSFTYNVGAASITIPGEYINYSPVDAAGKQCYGGIQPDTDIGFSIFGDVALKAAFVVFKDDGAAPQLGFAQKKL